VIRLRKQNAQVIVCSGSNWRESMLAIVERNTDYSDGRKLPNTYAIYGKRIIDLSGLDTVDRVVTLADMELTQAAADDQIIVVCSQGID